MAAFAMLKAPLSRSCNHQNAASTHRTPISTQNLTPTCSAARPSCQQNLQEKSSGLPNTIDRRDTLLLASGTLLLSTVLQQQEQALADDFTVTPSGLKYLDIRAGSGATPQNGDTVVVHWSGYTKGYQGKRIDNTSTRDEPYSFKLGAGEAIAAFEEAVATMQPGGIRRVEVPGDKPELGYSLDRNVRFTNEIFSNNIYKYRVGPQPVELGGQRALDFVLDNETLQPFNRTLLFDIKLLSVRPKK